MDKNINNTNKIWFTVLATILIALSFFIPAKSGLPHRDYKGCERKNSICFTASVKGIYDRPDGSRIVTVSPSSDIKDIVKKSDFSFKINDSNDNISIGNTVVIDANQDTNKAFIWIEYNTNLFIKLVQTLFDVWHGPTATIDLNTYTEIPSDKK